MLSTREASVAGKTEALATLPPFDVSSNSAYQNKQALSPYVVNHEQFAAEPTLPPPSPLPVKSVKLLPDNNLLVTAPKNMIFPAVKTSNTDKVNTVGMEEGKDNFITVVNHREKGEGWTLTISCADFTDKEEKIRSQNLTMVNYHLSAVEGVTDNITLANSINFKKANEPYLLAKQTGEYGTFSWFIGLKLLIPASIAAGDYSTQIILTIL